MRKDKFCGCPTDGEFIYHNVDCRVETCLSCFALRAELDALKANIMMEQPSRDEIFSLMAELLRAKKDTWGIKSGEGRREYE